MLRLTSYAATIGRRAPVASLLAGLALACHERTPTASCDRGPCTVSAAVAGTIRYTAGAPASFVLVAATAYADSCAGAAVALLPAAGVQLTDSTGRYLLWLRSASAPVAACVAASAVSVRDTGYAADTIVAGKLLSFHADNPPGGPRDTLVVDLRLRHQGVPGLHLFVTQVPPAVQLTATLASDSLVYIVFHNVAAVPATLTYGGCAFAARIWNGPDFTHLAWQSVPPAGTYACPDWLQEVAVPANDSLRMIAAVLAAAPPGIGPPPTYGDVRAYINANGQLLELEAGVRNVASVQ